MKKVSMVPYMYLGKGIELLDEYRYTKVDNRIILEVNPLSEWLVLTNYSKSLTWEEVPVEVIIENEEPLADIIDYEEDELGNLKQSREMDAVSVSSLNSYGLPSNRNITINGEEFAISDYTDTSTMLFSFPDKFKELDTVTVEFDLGDELLVTKVGFNRVFKLPNGRYVLSTRDNTGIYNIKVLQIPESCKHIQFINNGNITGDVDLEEITGLDSLNASFSYNLDIDKSMLSKLDTSNVTNMSYMFNNCSSLTSLDVSNFDTSKVTSMSYMFQNCNNLTSLDVSNFDTSKVTSMSYMFYSCGSLTSLDLSNFNTSNVTNMSYMFYSCGSLTSLDLSNFDTSNVTSMSYMFQNCNNLTSLDVSNFNTSNVTNMWYMFYNCNSLTSLDVSNFNTSNVTNMTSMFYGCSSLTSLDVSNFNTSNVTNMTNMFYYCSKLTKDLSSWNVNKVTSYSNFNSNAPGITPPIWVN